MTDRWWRLRRRPPEPETIWRVPPVTATGVDPAVADRIKTLTDEHARHAREQRQREDLQVALSRSRTATAVDGVYVAITSQGTGGSTKVTAYDPRTNQRVDLSSALGAVRWAVDAQGVAYAVLELRHVALNPPVD
jgi:hypothetical protein